MTTVLGMGLSTAFTIGVLKKGQTDSQRQLEEHSKNQRREMAAVKESLDRMSDDIHSANTAAVRTDERLAALERSAETGLSSLRSTVERSQRDASLARDELKGEIKRHGRDLEVLKVWRAGVNQKLHNLDPDWRAE